MAKHKAPKRAKQKGGGGGGGGGVKVGKTKTRSTPRVTKSRTRRPTTRTVRGRAASGAYRFIDAPPRKDMKRKSPDSAPRLYEWLVSEGYVEPVNTGSATTRGNRRTRGR